MKKIISLLLVIGMLASLFVMPVSAAEDVGAAIGNCTLGAGTELTTDGNYAIFDEVGDSATYTFDVVEAAVYDFNANIKGTDTVQRQVAPAMYLDGVLIGTGLYDRGDYPLNKSGDFLVASAWMEAGRHTVKVENFVGEYNFGAFRIIKTDKAQDSISADFVTYAGLGAESPMAKRDGNTPYYVAYGKYSGLMQMNNANADEIHSKIGVREPGIYSVKIAVANAGNVAHDTNYKLKTTLGGTSETVTIKKVDANTPIAANAEFTLINSVALSAGTYDLDIEKAGSAGYYAYLDKITVTKIGELEVVEMDGTFDAKNAAVTGQASVNADGAVLARGPKTGEDFVTSVAFDVNITEAGVYTFYWTKKLGAAENDGAQILKIEVDGDVAVARMPHNDAKKGETADADYVTKAFLTDYPLKAGKHTIKITNLWWYGYNCSIKEFSWKQTGELPSEFDIVTHLADASAKSAAGAIQYSQGYTLLSTEGAWIEYPLTVFHEGVYDISMTWSGGLSYANWMQASAFIYVDGACVASKWVPDETEKGYPANNSNSDGVDQVSAMGSCVLTAGKHTVRVYSSAASSVGGYWYIHNLHFARNKAASLVSNVEPEGFDDAKTAGVPVPLLAPDKAKVVDIPEDAYLHVYANVCEAGYYNVSAEVRDGGANAELQVLANGTQANLTLEGTGSGTYSTKNLSGVLYLNRGKNDLTLRTSYGTVTVDRLKLTPANGASVKATPQKAALYKGSVADANLVTEVVGGENYVAVADTVGALNGETVTLVVGLYKGVTLSKVFSATGTVAAGSVISKTFTVPNDGADYKVKLFQLDGFSTMKPHTATSDFWQTASKTAKLYFIGDEVSRLYDDASYPVQGWGNQLTKLLSDKITLVDKSKDGASFDNVSETWDEVKETLASGDFVVVALGKNDDNNQVITNVMTSMIKDAKAKNAEIIFTSAVPSKNDSAANAERIATAAVIERAAKNGGAVYIDLNGRLTEQYKLTVKDILDEDIAVPDMFYLSNYSKRFYEQFKSMSAAATNLMAQNNGDLLVEKGAKNVALKFADGLKSEGARLEKYVLDLLDRKPDYRELPAYSRTSADGKTEIKAILISGSPHKGIETEHFAYVGIPVSASASNKVPGIVFMHGAGGGGMSATVMEHWGRNGYASISAYWVEDKVDYDKQTYLNGQPVYYYRGPRRTDVYNNSQFAGGAEDHNMAHAINLASISYNWLNEQVEVQKDNIGLTGLSWGGMLTSCIIGRETRFKFAMPVYGSANLDVGTANIKGPFFYDGKYTYANAVEKDIPIFWINTYGDWAFSLHATAKSVQETAEVAKARIIEGKMHGTEHGSGASGEIPEMVAFADYVLKGGPALPEVSVMTQSGNNVSFTYNAPSGVSAITFFYNTTGIQYANSASPATNEWSKTAVSFSGSTGTINYTLPTGIKGFYFELTDANGLKMTTDYIELATAVQ